jgi:serine/threonine protein kinase
LTKLNSSFAKADPVETSAMSGSEIVFSRVSRSNAVQPPATTMLAVSGRTSSPQSRRLVHEYRLAEHLDQKWALLPVEISFENDLTTLFYEDPGGDLPGHVQLGEMDTEAFLGFAIGVARAVGEMHKRGLVHKDIRPANIAFHATTEQVRLTGFGIATRLPRERQIPEPPALIAGTFAYMAPASRSMKF